MTETPAGAGPSAAQDVVRPAGHIRLYIAGSTPNSLRAQQSLRDATSAISDTAARLTFEVIDVFKGPKRAIADGILVTPTLVVQHSGERVVMVGDLSDAAALRSVLEACARASEETCTTGS